MNEHLLKSSFEIPIHVQNSQLYLSGVIFNVIGISIFEQDQVIGNGFFDGYSFMTWLLIVNSAFSGISISFVFKYLDNMTRVFAQTAAMMVGLVLSVYLFDFIPTIGFISGFIVVCIAIYLYNVKGDDISIELNTTTNDGKRYIGVPIQLQDDEEENENEI